MTNVVYQADGLIMTGYLARPAGAGPWPAVLIGHDGVGLEHYQRSRADALAARGYIAFAMDYHAGESFFGRPEAMLARTLPILADDDRMKALGEAALAQLLAQPGVDVNRLAALGFGAGGLILLKLAKAGVPFRATALVHPALPNPADDSWNVLTGSFFLCTGSEDPIVTPAQILTFGHRLQGAGLSWQANIYGGAKHAFWATEAANINGVDNSQRAPTAVPGVEHHPLQATRAWRDVLDHLGTTFANCDV